ncbi:hypothetical protein [Arthrobacter cavernae]|uniref:Uncharacterized protein n=1 Tax=Arthrobacter cavernae TaxID=2817681 RepID=A0A939HEX2_9MICC|nr:hypothetical protein [Arthrobacter cavernae]MBO1267093.1 hypothetical protein [Arthrobacter cavernae]
MARTLDAIISELDPGYAGSRTTAQNQINALPGETQSQLDGLKATAEQSHEDILGGARRRGLGFGGIPIGEQVKYDSTVFKPAVANLYSAQNARRSSLEESLNALYRDQRQQALGIQQTELSRDEQQRQFNENMAFQREQMARQEAEAARDRAAASTAGIGSYFGGGGGGTQAKSGGTAQMSQRGDKGFSFTDANGNAISAATFAKTKGIEFRALLDQMAKAGDKGAAQALGYVGNDFGVNNDKLRQEGRDVSNALYVDQTRKLLNALLW